MEEKQLEFARGLYGKYGITDENKIKYIADNLNKDFEGTLSAFYGKYNPDKEIDWSYFNQVKNDYFQPITMEESIPLEDAPSGFFANMKNHLDNVPEAVANSFWSGLNFIDRGIDNAFDIAVEGISGIPQSGESGNSEFFMNKIQQNDQSVLPTKGILDENATIPERLSGVAGVTIDFARSIASGVISGGALPILEQVDGMYRSALEEKAKATGKNPLQLMIDNEDEELEPLLYGAVAAGLEMVGLKGVGKYINSLPKDAKSNAIKFLYTNTKEGGTEWLQGLAENMNTATAQGKDIGEAFSDALSTGFSREGAETFVGGFAGAAGIGYAGRQIKKALTPKEKIESVEVTEEDSLTPEEQEVENTLKGDAAIVSAMQTVESGDTDIDQMVSNVIRETEQEVESKRLEEAMAKKAEASPELVPPTVGAVTTEAPVVDKKAEKEEVKKQEAKLAVDAGVAKEISRTIRDKESLKKALYSFIGASETDKDAVEQVNTFASFYDGVIGARAKREGISKREWYLSRFASIGTKQSEANASETTFLEDGRAIITALGKPDPRSFFQEFSKVLQKDLNDTEASALEAEFGVNFKSDLSEESFKQFATAFESYMETGAIPAKIQGNTAQFVRAAFGKIAQWMRDIKANISGDSSLYVNSNIRKIFDSIVTGKDIEASQDRDVNSTVMPKDDTVIDMTDTQEEVINQTIVDNEQKTEKISQPSVRKTPESKRTRPQVDPATRKRDAFRESQKGFEVSPTGSIKGGPVSLKKAISSMQSLATDPDQDELTKEEARREVMRLMEIESNANKVKSSVDERNKNVSKIKEEVTKAGYDVKGLNELFSNKAKVPLEYKDGYVAYLDVTTGEVEEYSLYKNKSSKTTLAKFQSPESAKKRELEKQDRAVDLEKNKQIKKEKERESKAEKSIIIEQNKAADKANDAYYMMDKKGVDSKKVNSVIDSMEKVDPIKSFFAERSGDVSKKELAKEFTSFVNIFLKNFSGFKTPREFNAGLKDFQKSKERLLSFINNNQMLNESQKTELLEEINKVVSNLQLHEETFKKKEESKSLKKEQGGVKGTVLDEKVTIQKIGFAGSVEENTVKDKEGNDVVVYTFKDNDFAKKLTGLYNDLLRGFNLSRKIIIVDVDFFSDDKKVEFNGMTADQIAQARENEKTRIAAIMSTDKIFNIFGRISNTNKEDIRKEIDDSIKKTISGEKNAFAVTGEKFSAIFLPSSRKGSVIASVHEFGHALERDIFDKADKATKEAIEKDYKKWFQGKKVETFLTTSTIGIGNHNKQKSFDSFGKTFSEYFAEQVAFWANTEKTPSGVVEKFFGDVAKAIKKLFSMYREEYGVSVSITNLLNDKFYLDGARASAAEISNRNSAINGAGELSMYIIDNNRLITDIEMDSIAPVVIPFGTKDEDKAGIVKDYFASKKKKRIKIDELKNRNNEYEEEIKSKYQTYLGNGGTMEFDIFREKTLKIGEEMLSAQNYSELMSGISQKENRKTKSDDADEDNDEADDSQDFNNDPIVNFSTNPSNPRSGSKRDVFIDRISTAIDGKFTTHKEFRSLILAINKSLKASGETTISSKEADSIIDKTKSGSIIRVYEPIYNMINKHGLTKELADVIKSFSATRKERDDALTEADDMVKSGAALSDEMLDKFNRLNLVGLYNTTVAEREALIKDKVSDSIAKNESSKISLRVKERSNADRLRIAESLYSSVFGFDQISEGVYRFVINGVNGSKSFVANIYDRNKVYKKDDLVEYGGNIFRVTELIDKFESGFKKKMDHIGSINKHQTKAELHKKPWFKALQEKISNFNVSAQGIESLGAIVSRMDKEGAFEGRLSEMLGEEGFRKAARAQRKHRINVENKYIGLGERIFGVSGTAAVNKILYKKRAEIVQVKFKDDNGNDISIPMTRGEMMTWYAYMGQADLIPKFKGMEENFKSMPSDARYWSKAKQDAIIDSLSDQDKSFVNGVITEVLPYVYDVLNTAHRRELGYDMQLIQNYFPTKVETANTNEAQMSTIDTSTVNYGKFISSVSNQNTVERRSSAPLKVDDFFAQFLQYSEKAIHYAEYVGPLKRASLLFQNHKYEYAGYFNSVFGSEIMQQIKKNLDNIAFGAPAHFERNKLADTLRSLGIGGAFMANTTLFFKQAASFVAMASDMSWRDFSKYYVTTDWKGRLADIQEILAMDFTKERISQHGKVSYDTYGLMFDNLEKALNKSDLELKGEAAMAAVNKVLFAPVMAGDIAAVLMGGAPYLHSLKEKAKVKFPNDPDRQKEWVEIKFEEKVSRTQQSRDIMDQSSIQTAGSWASWFTTFMSTPILYGRLLSGAIRDVNKGLKTGNKELTKKGLKTGIMFSVVAPLFFQVASTGGTLILDSLGFGDDEEDDQIKAWKYNTAQIAASFIQHVPVVYQTVQYFIDRFARDSNFDLAISAPEQMYSRGVEAMADIADQLSRDDFDMSNKDTQRAMNDALKMVGVNYKALTGLSSNWYELFTEGEVEDIRLLFGYSPYAIQ